MEEIQLAGGNCSTVVHRLFDPYNSGHAADDRGHPGMADPHAPYGLRGWGAADDLVDAGHRGGDPGRDGVALTRVPVRPEHLVLAHA